MDEVAIAHCRVEIVNTYGLHLRAAAKFEKLVSLAISNARNSTSMFGKPSAHLLIRPRPFKGMSVAFVVLRPRGGNMGDEFLPTRPRPALR